MSVRESVCDTLLKTLHTHTLSYCCKSHSQRSPLQCWLGMSARLWGTPSSIALSLALSLTGWVFSHYTPPPPPPPHTHTSPPPSVLHVVFIEELRAVGPSISLFFISFFAAFPCYSGSCGLPRGGMKDDTLNTPPSAPPQNIHYWNINSSPTFQSPSKFHNSTPSQKKTWDIIKTVQKSTVIGDKYSLSYGCMEFCLVYTLYLNDLVTFVHQC